MISSGQMRAARAMLGWTGEHLAQKAKVGIVTIWRYEGQEDHQYLQGLCITIFKLKQAMEAGGIEFMGKPGVDAGVRLHFKGKTDGGAE